MISLLFIKFFLERILNEFRSKLSDNNLQIVFVALKIKTLWSWESFILNIICIYGEGIASENYITLKATPSNWKLSKFSMILFFSFSPANK